MRLTAGAARRPRPEGLRARVAARRARVAALPARLVAGVRGRATQAWRQAVALTDRAEGRIYEAVASLYGVVVLLSLLSAPLGGGLCLALVVLSAVVRPQWRPHVLAVSLVPLLVGGAVPLVTTPAVALVAYACYRLSHPAFAVVVLVAAGTAVWAYYFYAPGGGAFALAGLAAGALVGWSTQARDEATRLARANAALSRRAVTSEQRSAWLAERLDLARELHDVVGHQVTGMVVQAEAARSAGGDRDAALAEIATLGRAALSELDVLVRRIRVADDGARATVPPLGEVTTTVTRLLELRGITPTVTVDAAAFDGFDDAERLALCRILQEAVVNVVRHSGAVVARVSVERDPAGLDLVVADDGRGLDGAPRGAGLDGLDERVRMLGGTWHLAASVPHGTVLSVRVPRQAGAAR